MTDKSGMTLPDRDERNDSPAYRSYIEYRCEACDFQTKDKGSVVAHRRKTGHPFAEWRF